MEKFNQLKLFIYENKKKFLISLILVVCFILITIILLTKNFYKSTDDNILLYETIAETKDKTQEENNNDLKKYYYVDIKGFVNNPGVYTLEEGNRVIDAINKAGGLKENANTSLLNLSREVFDEMIIIVYSNEELTEYQKTKEEITQAKKICTEVIVNDACAKEEDYLVKNEDTSLDNLTSEKININTSTKEQLMTLSKIGESKALAIIEYRTKNGLFQTIDEIKQVSGIGDSLFETIKDYITV